MVLGTSQVGNAAIVVTTIAPPTPALLEIAEGAKAAGWSLIVVGDRKTPADFALGGARFLGVRQQAASGWKLASELEYDHYARKNLGYLEAISLNVGRIVETDDDNFPKASFFEPIEATVPCRPVRGAGWINVYRLFTDRNVWPRGFPLNRIRSARPAVSDALEELYCPIQQALADDDPDVDAIYRMVVGEAVAFDAGPPVALAPGAICPINSQNTAWWPDAFPLLYLPSCCSFRMTDIWRGLIASRIAAARGWNVLFRSATMYQRRNAHDHMDDFAKEIDGYLRNGEIAEILANTELPTAADAVPDALMICYRVLCEAGIFPSREIELVESWLSDLEKAKAGARHG